MRRFRFKLEAVRELREQVETSAKEALARELAEGRAREAALADADARLAEARNGCAVPRDTRVDARSLRIQQGYAERRERERAQAARDAQTQAERIAAGRSRLAKAAQEREAVERLRRWQERDHVKAAERAEQQLLEDIGPRTTNPFVPPSAA